MRSLVIGYGSIGQRHARLLNERGLDVAVVSRRAVDHPKRFATLDAALNDHRPDYVVVASATSEHHSDVARLAELGFSGRVLVEKPIFEAGQTMPEHKFETLHVAYNLRFHPVIQALSERLSGERILQIHAYIGQYLPDWRPGTDYRESYSARLDRGGGVLLDLSHDLDLLNGLAGPWTGLVALGGHVSDLEIDSDDVASFLIRFSRCPAATLSMNYLDRRARRELVVNCAARTFRADLIASTLETDRESVSFPVERDTTYRAMHEAALGDGQGLCKAEEALDVLDMIGAARSSFTHTRWTERTALT